MNSLRAVVGIGGAVGLALLGVGCGQRSERPPAPVRLSLQAPADGARIVATAATVTGDVMPHGARVLVLGRQVAADASGHFSARVALSPGTNLIDVIASAPRARPAMIALRVIRYLLVTVPDVTGRSPAAAAALLRKDGLKPVLRGDSNPFSFLCRSRCRSAARRPRGARGSSRTAP